MRIRSWYLLPCTALFVLPGCALSPPVGQGPTPAAAPSTMEKMTSSVGSGAKKMVAWVKPVPKVVPAKDPIALETGSPKMGADILVHLARIHESKGNYPAATLQYQKALEVDSKDLSAILGYAHLLDRQNKLPEATTYYETAVRLHPKSATAHNDLGLCYARCAMHDRAAESLRQAASIEPTRPLYRNNLATVLVEMGRSEEALRELIAVHEPATAHYNLGYLMQQKGQNQQAARHFAEASRLNPQLTAAQTWLAKLSPPAGPSMAAAAPAQSPPREPARPVINAQPVSATIDAVEPPQAHSNRFDVNRYDESPRSGAVVPIRTSPVRLPSTGSPQMDAPGPPSLGR